MMHLCRKLFPTILNEEGNLIKILDDNFGCPKYLYNDIIAKNKIDNFKDFIYSIYATEKELVDSKKTPFELFDDAGYTLYECKNYDDIIKFKKYYVKDEELCTFYDKRLDSCYVFFAIKKNVDDIKREDFKNPKRDDIYGTSVISIQFTKGVVNTLSIKNRYNYKVENSDATFDNDLDNIVLGLTSSFQNYYNLNINQNKTKLRLGYVKANDRKYYKYNLEINNIYYCPDNIIIDNGQVIDKYKDKEKYLVIDSFIVDLQRNRKSIFMYDDYGDSFKTSLTNFDKIKIIKNKDKTKDIIFNKKGYYDVEIRIDSLNNIIGYKNLNLTKIGSDFLMYNKKLKNICIDNVKIIGDNFLLYNECLNYLRLPNVEQIGDDFMASACDIIVLILDSVKNIGSNFLYWNDTLYKLEAPKLECVGDNFLKINTDLEELLLPKSFYKKEKVLKHILKK